MSSDLSFVIRWRSFPNRLSHQSLLSAGVDSISACFAAKYLLKNYLPCEIPLRFVNLDKDSNPAFVLRPVIHCIFIYLI